MSSIPGLEQTSQVVQANNINNVPNNDLDTNHRTKWNDDLFGLHTLDECESNFEDYCERRIDQYTDVKEKLSILRSCLELLKRLEGTRRHLFAGRVLIFLARVLPFFDASGLNKTLEFDNRDIPESVKSTLEKISQKQNEKLKAILQYSDNDIEEGETLSDDDDQNDDFLPSIAAHQTDPDKLYERFWRVQKLLSHPNSLYDKNNWISFRTTVDSLLIHFESIPASCRVWDLSKFYMTEPKALSLQMNDVNLRRCFILQILIILHYLDSPVDLRPDSFQLDKHQTMWLASTVTRCCNFLENIPEKDEGRKFLQFVTQIMRNEDLWNKWKNEKCHEPEKPKIDDDEIINMGSTYHKRRKIGDEIKAAKPYNIHVIGSPDMTKLWNRRPQPLLNAPDITTYFDLAPEKQQERFKDPNISFRMLRLLRKNPHFFVPAASMITPIDGYLKTLAEKHFKLN